MRFETEMADGEVPETLRKFVELTGWSTWSKRLEWLEREIRRETGMQHFWRERCALELAFSAMWRRWKTTRRLRVETLGLVEFRFLSFAAMVVRCHRVLTRQGKNRLLGMVRDAVNRDHGLGSVAYEMKVASHLMSRGYDVEFHDMEEGGGFDFLVTKDHVQMEVECKFWTGDIGRKIHRKQLYQLGDRVSSEMLAYLGRLRTGLFLQLTIPDRLHGTVERQEALHELLGRAMVRGDGEVNGDGNHVAVRGLDIQNVGMGERPSRDLDREWFKASLLEHFGVVNKNALVYVRPGQSAIVIVIESRAKDQVLKGIHRELKKSAKGQFSGVLPALLCCHLADVSEEQLLGLRNKGDVGIGLGYMTTDVLLGRPHVFSVTYTAPGSVRRAVAYRGDGSNEYYQERGPGYTIYNHHHPSVDEKRLYVFRGT